ncbi:hypothetical protein JXR93_03305 [bacterium]|nr:hypothetical protein [bacterium]
MIKGLQPFLFGSLFILLFLTITTTISFILMNNGLVYLIGGVLGSFGGGFFIYRFAKPISPLTSIVIVPIMFAGIFLSEYIDIKVTKIEFNRTPSSIKLDTSIKIFELIDYKILTKMISKYSFTRREKDRVFHKTVCTIPIVNSDWVINNQIDLFAVCEKDNCSSCFSENQKFGKIVKLETSDNFKSYIESVKNGAKKNSLNIKIDKLIFVELIEDIDQYAQKKRDSGIIIFLSLLFIWNFISIFSFKKGKENI